MRVGCDDLTSPNCLCIGNNHFSTVFVLIQNALQSSQWNDGEFETGKGMFNSGNKKLAKISKLYANKWLVIREVGDIP